MTQIEEEYLCNICFGKKIRTIFFYITIGTNKLFILQCGFCIACQSCIEKQGEIIKVSLIFYLDDVINCKKKQYETNQCNYCQKIFSHKNIVELNERNVFICLKIKIEKNKSRKLFFHYYLLRKSQDFYYKKFKYYLFINYLKKDSLKKIKKKYIWRNFNLFYITKKSTA